MADETIQRTSVVDTVTERLRDEILRGEIQPGERIRVAALEERFSVSHIPIREALRRLESEGLVVTSPQRATLAADVSITDLGGLYDLRRIIEAQVARRAVAQMTEENLESIRGALAEMEAIDDPQAAEFWELHRAFHWAILAPAGSDWIRRVLDQLWQAAERYVRLSTRASGRFSTAMQEHHDIVEACEARDPDRLAELLDQHLVRTELAVREGYPELRRDVRDNDAGDAARAAG